MTKYSSDYLSSSGGSSVLKIQNITSDNTVDDWSYLVLADASSLGSNLIVTLPLNTTTSIGKSIIIKKVDNSNSPICIIPNGTDTIDGLNSSQYLYNQGDCITITSSESGKCEILPDNRQGTGSSKSFMMAKTNATTSFPSVPVDIDFDTVVASYGSDITVDTNGVFTLKASKTYKLEAEIVCSSTGTGQLTYAWVNSSNTELVANTGRGIIEGDTDYTHGMANIIYSPSVDTQVKVRAISGNPTIGNLTVASTRAYIECLTTQATVINTVDTLYAVKTANQAFTTSGDVTFVKQNGNITFDGIYATLLAGKTYEINTGMKGVDSLASGFADLVFADNSNNVLGNSNFNSLGIQYAGSNFAPMPNSSMIITPTSNIQIKVRVVNVNDGTHTVSVGSYFIIKQLGSTACTGVDMNLLTGGEWQTYTPTIGATTTAPTLATTKTLRGRYRVVGKTLSVQFEYYASSATGATTGTGVYTFSLPSGYTINTTLAPIPSTIVSSNGNYSGADGSTLGFGSAGATSFTQCAVTPLSTNTVGLYMFISSDVNTSATLVGSGVLPVNANNRTYRFTAEIPIN